MEDQTLPRRTAGFYVQRTIGAILLLALAATFLFSAWTKLIAIEPFEWAFQDMGIRSNTAVAILARVFAGLEVLIGLLLLAHVYLRRLTYPLVLIFLTIMTGYLLYLLAIQGNTGNCGCFGDTLHMKPLEAILKNIGMAGVTFLLMFIYNVQPYKGQQWLSLTAAMVGIMLPFVWQPLSQRTEPVDLNPLYTTAGEQHPAVELRTGRHIIAFMSLTCPHCRKAAKELVKINKDYPGLPLFMVLNGLPGDEADFFNETRSAAIPHIRFTGVDDFVQMAGKYVPAIYWVNNSIKERKVSYMALSGAAMKRWAELK